MKMSKPMFPSIPIVIPIRDLVSKEDDERLVLTLRALERWQVDVSKVVVVGKRRPWMKELQVVNIAGSKALRSKFYRVTDKLLIYCRIGQPFCLMNDDMVMTQPWLFGENRHLAGESFIKKIDAVQNTQYKRFLNHSREQTPLKGNAPDFCLHTPFIVTNPIEAVHKAPTQKNGTIKGVSFRQLVGELQMLGEEPPEIITATDNKINDAHTDINKSLKFGPVVSFGPNGWTDRNRQILFSIYGQKSSFEEYSVI